MTTTTEVTLAKRYVLAGMPGWGEHDHLIRSQGLAVVNAPRPIAGDITWVGELGYGRYYAAGDLEQMAEGWHADDAVLLVELTPQAIVRRVKAYVDSYGSSLDKLAATYEGAVGDVAHELGLPWDDAWLQVPFLPAVPSRVAISGIPLCEHNVQAQAWALQVVRPGEPLPDDIEIGSFTSSSPTSLLRVKTRAAAIEGRADQFQIAYLHKDLFRTADDPASI
ncbi:hypothetical protein E1286_46080 [Nonomuraea terrae]|uniref:Uncharacterized protein n=1 Tax=Nonomuraea terrae TaxID=2530383 RepID=A0A4R4XH97_9ACTN|nr:hypothetical protein [Nonomuraea terrae]TDD30185.1 hypothetical protein E1286_46080 [Nonomuraea terrae]